MVNWLYVLETLAREAYEAGDREIYDFATLMQDTISRGFEVSPANDRQLRSALEKYHIDAEQGGKVSINASIRKVAGRHLQAASNLTIRGRKYTLSNFAGPFGAENEYNPVTAEHGQENLVRGPSSGRKYLWAFNIERKELSMWRVVDGVEKLSGPVRSYTEYVAELNSLGQLNFVTNQQEADVYKAMDDLSANHLKLGSEKTQINLAVLSIFDRVFRDQIERYASEIDNHTVPWGFKVSREKLNQGINAEKQVREFCLNKVLDTFIPIKVAELLEFENRAHGTQHDITRTDDVYWAIEEIKRHAHEEFVGGKKATYKFGTFFLAAA